MTEPVFLMDADVFISAKNGYYAFEICPGFWDSLAHYFGTGNIRSIDKVRNELLAGRDSEDLFQWVKNDLSAALFLDTTQADVVGIRPWALRRAASPLPGTVSIGRCRRCSARCVRATARRRHAACLSPGGRGARTP